MNRIIKLEFLGVTFQYDWMDAPRWANHLVITKQGVIELHEKRPVFSPRSNTYWHSSGKHEKLTHIEHWQFEKPMIFGCPENLIVNQ